MATLQKIRAKGPLLVIVIGLALFAFIAEEAMRSIQSASNESKQQVGEIYGERISVHEFQNLVDEYAEVVARFQRSVRAACAAYTLNDDFAKAAE